MTPTERVQAALDDLGLDAKVQVFDASTATAQEAADAVGCERGQIVKTLMFMADGRPTLVLAAGDRQVDTVQLSKLVGVGRKKLKMAPAETVLELTGYPVGGLTAIGLPEAYDVVVDTSLQRFDRVWAAAGTPNAVFGVDLQRLVDAVGGQWGDIARPLADAP